MVMFEEFSPVGQRFLPQNEEKPASRVGLQFTPLPVHNLTDGCESAPSSTNLIIKGITARRIRLEVLHWTLMSDAALWDEYLNLFGQHVKCVYFEYVYSQTPETAFQVLRKCPSLKSVACSGGFFSALVLDLLSSCEHLQSLELNNVCFVGDASLLDTITRRMNLKYIDLNCDEFTLIQILNLCVPVSVRWLRLNRIPALPWHRFTSLRTLNFAIIEPSDSARLIEVLSACPWVQNLCIPHAENPTSANVRSIASTLHSICSLDIQSAPKSVPEHAILALVDRHRSTLQALFIHGCKHISAAAINSILQVCPMLRTISFTYRDGVDFKLIASISALQITDISTAGTAFSEILQHCRKLQYLSIDHPWGSASLDLAALTTAPYPLPALRTICLPSVTISDYERTRTALYENRPTVRLLKDMDNAWYRRYINVYYYKL